MKGFLILFIAAMMFFAITLFDADAVSAHHDDDDTTFCTTTCWDTPNGVRCRTTCY